jgi:cell division protein FtsB
MRLPKRLNSTLIIVILVIIFLSLSALQFNQWRKRRSIQKEINHLVQQQQEYQQKNQDLEDSLNLISTRNFKEKIAREQLNLKKDGEIVVNFPSLPQSDNSQSVTAVQTNPQKWWNYFFGPN